MSFKDQAKAAIKRIGLHRPLRKLVSPAYRRDTALARRLIESINQRGFDRLRRKHAASTDNSRKYLDLECYVPEAVRDARRLRLLECKPLRVLDIGCGSAYFLFALRSAGHEVLGLDLSETALYNDTVELLEIPRLVHRVERFQRLPATGAPLDLITAFSICFDLHWTKAVWGPDEWMFFLDDCRSRLRPGGLSSSILIRLARRTSVSYPIPSPQSCALFPGPDFRHPKSSSHCAGPNPDISHSARNANSLERRLAVDFAVAITL